MEQKFAPVQFKSFSSLPLKVNDYTITLRSQALIVRLPFCWYVWNRASSVIVEKNGTVKYLPLIDYTRLAQIALFISKMYFTSKLAKGMKKEQ